MNLFLEAQNVSKILRTNLNTYIENSILELEKYYFFDFLCN